MGISFVMATVVAATAASGCSWAHPGANPYRGDPTSALADFAMADDTRRRLRALMAAHHYTDVATITRDDIVGQQHYDDLREMHSGHGQTCHGAVDRSAWSDQVQERGLVYCAGDTCVIVPTICNNVSLVTRKPDEHAQAAEDDGPIDISPSAGPPPMAATAPSNEDSGQATPEFLPAPPGDSGSSVDDNAGGGGTSGAACCFIGSGGNGGGGAGNPIASGPTGTPGSSPTGPTGTPPVGSSPPVSAVPEAPASMLMLAGLAVLLALARRSRRAAG